MPLITVLEERFQRKVEYEVHALSERMEQRFGEIQKRFGEVQNQITNETRWLIALIAFLAVAFKVLEL